MVSPLFFHSANLIQRSVWIPAPPGPCIIQKISIVQQQLNGENNTFLFVLQNHEAVTRCKERDRAVSGQPVPGLTTLVLSPWQIWQSSHLQQKLSQQDVLGLRIASLGAIQHQH